MSTKTGEVIWFSKEKSYGFIRPYTADPNSNGVADGGGEGRSLKKGDVVEYDEYVSRSGKTATNVVVLQAAGAVTARGLDRLAPQITQQADGVAR